MMLTITFKSRHAIKVCCLGRVINKLKILHYLVVCVGCIVEGSTIIQGKTAICLASIPGQTNLIQNC